MTLNSFAYEMCCIDPWGYKLYKCEEISECYRKLVEMLKELGVSEIPVIPPKERSYVWWIHKPTKICLKCYDRIEFMVGNIRRVETIERVCQDGPDIWRETLPCYEIEPPALLILYKRPDRVYPSGWTIFIAW